MGENEVSRCPLALSVPPPDINEVDTGKDVNADMLLMMCN